MDWGTVITAILGSTVLTGLINAIIERFKYTRRAEVLSSWKAEYDLAEELEKEAGVIDNLRNARGKAAFALAARSELHKKLANELVPPDRISLSVFAPLSLVAFIFGIIVMGYGLSNAPSGWLLGGMMALAGLAISTLFGVLFIALFHASMARDSLRGAIIRVLNVNLPYATKYVKYIDLDGKLTLRVCAGGRWQILVRNVMGVDVATTVEEFLRRTIDEQSGMGRNFIGPRLF